MRRYLITVFGQSNAPSSLSGTGGERWGAPIAVAIIQILRSATISHWPEMHRRLCRRFFRDRRGVLLVGDPPGRIAALLSNFRADPNQS
jgi:hypothetical protein